MILVLIGLFIRSKQAPPGEKQPAAAKPVKSSASAEFHAVSVKFASNACAAVKRLEGQRFLSGEAPRIPLPDCDVAECNCSFVHHKDRRTGDDRRNPYRAGIAGHTGSYQQEQRKGGDRRKDPDSF